jgi:HD-GYP domain-containing protein (c-di-GMP phosphodiesterase class II)
MKPELVEALVAAIELKDRSTAAHTWRVVLYARALAEEMGQSHAIIGRVTHAAALHDVGKLGVSSSVLCKPGPLTGAERAAMQKHAALGYELLSGLGEDDPLVLDLVQHHHERWDGQGYPDGLAGEAIHTASRLFAVIDSFDAMTSIRPYRAEVGPDAAERAILELERGSGTRYWPPAVEILVHLYRTGRLDWILEHFNDRRAVPRFGPIDLAEGARVLRT